MRLGEIKKTLDEVLNDDLQLYVESTPIYGGQAYKINNFSKLFQAIKIIVNQPWNGADATQISDLIEKSSISGDIAELTQDEFNRLNTYITALNTQISYYFSILQEMAEDQEEKVINIKLPTNIESLSDLSELNKKLEKLFKEFQLDGEIKLKGFDTGTDWYVLYLSGFLTYHFFIACLKIAQEFLKARTEYFSSEKARLDYEAALENKKDYSEDGLKLYEQRRLDLEIEKKVEKAVKEIKETNGAQEAELATKLVRATKDLISQIDSGVEFHLSLNPPSYTKEQNGLLEINYSSIQQLKKVQELEKKKDQVLNPPKQENKNEVQKDVKSK